MTLGDLIARLEKADPARVVPRGFARPHSYRGYYHDLAFEPTGPIPVGEMLAAAKSALGATYQGYKGGDYAMDEFTDCWLSEEGTSSNEPIGAILLDYMLGLPPGENAQNGPSVATLEMRVRYACKTMQDAHNMGVNPFAVQLLAESLGDKDKLVDGGVLLMFPEDHKHRPVWVCVTGQAPFVMAVTPDPVEPLQ